MLATSSAPARFAMPVGESLGRPNTTSMESGQEHGGVHPIQVMRLLLGLLPGGCITQLMLLCMQCCFTGCMHQVALVTFLLDTATLPLRPHDNSILADTGSEVHW